MKRAVVLCLVAFAAVLVLPMSQAAAEEPAAPWFDMEKCGMCSAIMAEKGLIDHVHWSYHNFAAGTLTTTTVDPGFEEPFARAGQKMNEVGERLAKGEQMYLCGHCTSFGSLMMSGVKMDNVKEKGVDIMILSAIDPALIVKIHGHADRSTAEMAKMSAVPAK